MNTIRQSRRLNLGNTNISIALHNEQIDRLIFINNCYHAIDFNGKEDKTFTIDFVLDASIIYSVYNGKTHDIIIKES